VVSVCVLCLLVIGGGLAGCGQATQAGSGRTASSPTTTFGHDAASNGCPAKQIPIDGAFQAAVTTRYTLGQQPPSAVELAVGQGWEIHLPPTVTWTWMLTDPNPALETVAPAGWYDMSLDACVWRFAATGAGSAQLHFSGPLLCQSGVRCTGPLEVITFSVSVR
jgi:hypothetical protein